MLKFDISLQDDLHFQDLPLTSIDAKRLFRLPGQSKIAPTFPNNHPLLLLLLKLSFTIDKHVFVTVLQWGRGNILQVKHPY